MAFSERLTKRIREALKGIPRVKEKRMFSGITFMINDKMCVSSTSKGLMLRFDPALQDEVKLKEGFKPMKMKGKNIKGFGYVDEAVLETKKNLDLWIQIALDYNEKAKASRKK
jgi:TfoX/Sxy family transcriptional regulator of competence genes